MAEPVTLALAKAHCRIDPSDTDHDEVLATYIQAARAWVEDFTGLVLVARPFTKAVEAFGSNVQLARRPVTAVVRTGDVAGRSVSVRVDLGGRGVITTKKNHMADSG